MVSYNDGVLTKSLQMWHFGHIDSVIVPATVQ